MSEREFAQEFVRKLVLAWDPDFTKATPESMRNKRENGKRIVAESVWKSGNTLFRSYREYL